MLRPPLLVGALLVLGLAGCGGGGGGGSKATASVTVLASGGVVVPPGGTLALTAVVEGGGHVSWSVDGGAANGTVSPMGVYTAPATQGTYTVRATAGGVSGTKSVTVTNGIAIAIASPTTVPLTIPASKLAFGASVTGSTDKLVTWTATGGAIGADGTFTAPSATGTYTVTATSHADGTKTARATVQVVANVNVRIKWQGKADVVIALDPVKAPLGAPNFVTLANKGFYDSILLHRYVENFVAQWGDPTTKGLTADAFPNVGFDVNDLLNVKYSVAYARVGDDGGSGSTQVFVNLKDNPTLNHKEADPSTSQAYVQGYSVFGSVISGQATIDALRQNDQIVSARTELP